MRTQLIALTVSAVLGIAAVGVGHTAFSAPSQDSRAGFDYFSLLESPAPLPGIAVQEAEGDDVVLAEREGLLLINVWATWCAPCVEEMPSLDALQAALGSDSFEVVTVSMDREGMDAVRPFFKKLGIDHLTPYLDPDGEFSLAMEARALPVTFLVKDGRVIGKATGPEDWSSDAAKKLIREHLN